MGCRLRMSDEIRDWLTDLRASDPSSARPVGAALTALLGEGAGLGPPMVVSLAPPLPQADLPEALDRSYQHRLDRLQIVRRGVSDAAMLTRRVQLQIAELESLQAKLDAQRRRALEAGRQDLAGEAATELAAADEQVAGLRRLLPGVIEAEQKLTEQGQRAQLRVDAFRTRKEVLKAAYIAAQAECAVDEAEAALHQDAGDQDAGDRGGQDEDPTASITAARDKLREVAREIDQELRAEPVTAGRRDRRPLPGLMELRTGAPGDSQVRILFAVEPPGTVLLIAVLEGGDDVLDQYNEAVLLSSDVLGRVRAGRDPEATARAFDDAESFLDAFFPGDASEVEADAAALVARNRARTLAEQRTRLGLTQAQVAERMGVRQERVSAIERAEPGATEVRTLASYVEALGGRLEIIADFGGARVVLR
jgi:phage shock protein A/DNA-binding XRE family transcriptional regulator